MNKSKLFKVALATSLATGALVATSAVNTEAAVTSFKDLSPSNDHYLPVQELASRGIIIGYEDGTFKPNRNVTRGQAAKIIAKSLNLDIVNVKNPGFQDVSVDHSYYGPIAALVNAGIITGFTEDNTYRPGDTLTRGQMSKILSLAYKLPVSEKVDNSFTDVKDSHWHKNYVQTLVDLNITKGTTPTTFAPNSPVKRGQLASFIIRTEKAVDTLYTEGNATLNTSIQSALQAFDNPIKDKLELGLNGKSLDVTIKDDTATIAEFSSVAQPVFDTFKTNTVIDSATITLPTGAIKTVESPSLNNISLETIFKNILAETGLPDTTPISFFAGTKVTVTVTGTHNNKAFSDTYQFNFKK